MKLAALALPALSLATCTQTPQVDGTRWTIASVDGDPVRTMRPIEIGFDRNRIAGTTGCSDFKGRYQINGEQMTTSRMRSNKLRCPGPGMEVEAKFNRIITNQMLVRLHGRTLTLTNSHGSATFFSVR